MPDRCRTRHLCTRARPSAARDPRTAPTGSRDVRQTACARHQPGDGRRPSAARTRLLLLLKATHLHAGNLGRTGRGPWRPRGSPARPPMIPRCPFSGNRCVLVCGERCVTCCGRAGVERPMSSEPPYAPLIIPARAGEKFEFGSYGVHWKIEGSQARGCFSVVYHPLALRSLGALLHRHHREDEIPTC